jgi:crossover junction endodeoxyribonuclease RuvC
VAICHAHSGEILGILGALAPGLVKKGLRVRGGRLVG